MLGPKIRWRMALRRGQRNKTCSGQLCNNGWVEPVRTGMLCCITLIGALYAVKCELDIFVMSSLTAADQANSLHITIHIVIFRTIRNAFHQDTVVKHFCGVGCHVIPPHCTLDAYRGCKWSIRSGVSP